STLNPRLSIRCSWVPMIPWEPRLQNPPGPFGRFVGDGSTRFGLILEDTEEEARSTCLKAIPSRARARVLQYSATRNCEAALGSVARLQGASMLSVGACQAQGRIPHIAPACSSCAPRPSGAAFDCSGLHCSDRTVVGRPHPARSRVDTGEGRHWLNCRLQVANLVLTHPPHRLGSGPYPRPWSSVRRKRFMIKMTDYIIKDTHRGLLYRDGVF